MNGEPGRRQVHRRHNVVVLGIDLGIAPHEQPDHAVLPLLGQSCGPKRSAQQRSYLGYESVAIILSAALTSDAAWDGDNTPELSKSFTSLMKRSRFSIAPAFFPAFIRFIACCSVLTSELSWPPFSTPWENRAFTALMMACVACCGVRTVKLAAFDVPSPGLVTVTLKIPAVAMSEARMAAG